jgi:hypothetical protein
MAKINRKKVQGIKYPNRKQISLKGYVLTTYDYLINKLGEPNLNPSGDKKVKCTWEISFQDGDFATIYDWKTKEIPRDLYQWQIGGASLSILDKVEHLLGLEVIGTPF